MLLLTNAVVIDLAALSLAPLALVAPFNGLTIVLTSWLASERTQKVLPFPRCASARAHLRISLTWRRICARLYFICVLKDTFLTQRALR